MIEPVLREPLVVALPQGHRFARRPALSVRVLADEPLIIFPRGESPSYHDTVVGLFAKNGGRLKIVQEVAQIQGHLGLVAGGFRISVLPASVQDLKRRDVVYRPLRGSPHIEMAMAYRRDRDSEVLRAFVDIVRTVAGPSVGGRRRAATR